VVLLAIHVYSTQTVTEFCRRRSNANLDKCDAKSKKMNTKVIFLNDGPGLLLGSMWRDYTHLETLWKDRVRVVTLRMVPERITLDWLRS
jgi:hypothetical protein